MVSFFSNLKSCVLTKCSDYNYERQVDGSCKLVPGLKPADHSESCRLDPDQIEYFAPTGYRRLTMSTCEGGREMDLAEAFACPGHDDEFNKKHGPTAWGIFFAVTIPIVVATGVGYWVWKNWANKFGQIRLGEQGMCSFLVSIASTSMDLLTMIQPLLIAKRHISNTQSWSLPQLWQLPKQYLCLLAVCGALPAVC
jgi:Sortilin, neurotensin receptor 3, C-terminal